MLLPSKTFAVENGFVGEDAAEHLAREMGGHFPHFLPDIRPLRGYVQGVSPGNGMIDELSRVKLHLPLPTQESRQVSPPTSPQCFKKSEISTSSQSSHPPPPNMSLELMFSRLAVRQTPSPSTICQQCRRGVTTVPPRQPQSATASLSRESSCIPPQSSPFLTIISPRIPPILPRRTVCSTTLPDPPISPLHLRHRLLRHHRIHQQIHPLPKIPSRSRPRTRLHHHGPRPPNLPQMETRRHLRPSRSLGSRNGQMEEIAEEAPSEV